MLTVRFMAMDGGELVVPVQSVRYIPPMAQQDGRILDRLNIIEESGGMTDFFEGTVYVMNDHGKTVATYHLISTQQEETKA